MEAADLIYPELSYQVVGACFDAFNEIGPEKKEVHYQRAVAIFLEKRGVPFREQVHAPFLCDGKRIGDFVLDFLVNGQLVLELKVGGRFRRQDFEQVRRYLVQHQMDLGILVRFGSDSVTFHRVLRPYS